jgi:RNA polymerase sigma-70 factor (ECF subfamily)
MDDVTAAVSQHVQVKDRKFDAFYASSWDDVYRPLAVTLRDPELAAEAVEEAMTRAYRSWRNVRDYENRPGWVYRVALNWATSYLRKTKREVHGTGPIDAAVAPTHPDMDLYNALGHLDVKHRAVVVLRYLLDWSEVDVASALDIPIGTVKSRLHRGLGKLREELS